MKSALFAMFMATLILSGCTADTTDLEDFVKPMLNQPDRVSHTDSIPPKSTSTGHENPLLRDPFSPVNSVADKPESSAIKPDEHRPREPLERYPLESLHWVGTIQQSGIAWALIQAEGGIVYRAHIGSYLGQNNGKVIALNNAHMEIRELEIQDNGIWREHLRHIDMATAHNKENKVDE